MDVNLPSTENEAEQKPRHEWRGFILGWSIGQENYFFHSCTALKGPETVIRAFENSAFNEEEKIFTASPAGRACPFSIRMDASFSISSFGTLKEFPLHFTPNSAESASAVSGLRHSTANSLSCGEEKIFRSRSIESLSRGLEKESLKSSSFNEFICSRKT